MERKEDIRKKYVAEFLGTLMFVFLSAGAGVAVASLGVTGYLGAFAVSFATGLALAMAISATMGVSGGHVNPAVTIGILTAGMIKLNHAIGYIISQVLGAFVGATLLFILFSAAAGNSVHWGTPTVAAAIPAVQAIAIEAIMTFFLVFAVFTTVVDKRAPRIAGFGVGIVVMLDAFVGGSLTGAAMNPARWAGPAMASLYFANWFVYILGPVIGAIAAAIIYKEFIE